MPSTLLQMRREAGYRSQRDFAERIGVPQPTYTRYESNPGKIPLKAAWAIADELGCTIDAVVGRATMEEVRAARGEVQREYDALSPANRELADELRAFLRRRQQDEEAAERHAERRRYERLCRQYERQMEEEADEGAAFGELLPFSEPGSYRAEFERFLEARAAEKRAHEQGDEEALARRDAGTVEKIMEAFDRLNGEG